MEPQENSAREADVSSSVPECEISRPQSQSISILSALFHPDSMEPVFQNLDNWSLKTCREVCKSWSGLATPFLHKDSVLCINLAEHRSSKERELLAKLDNGTLPSGGHYVISEAERFNVPQILNKINGDIKSLKLNLKLVENNIETVQQLEELSHLKSLTVFYNMNVISHVARMRAEEADRPTALMVADILKSAPNLEALYISYGILRIGTFCTTLFGPEGLSQAHNANFAQKLKYLCISNWSILGHEDFKVLRRMKLNLITLNLNIDEKQPLPRQDEPLPLEHQVAAGVSISSALCLWLEDLSPSLQSLSLRIRNNDGGERPVSLPAMSKLKTLKIHNPARYGGDDILELLKKLPKLETLSLTSSKSTGVKQKDMETLAGLSYPNLKEFLIERYMFVELNSLPREYVPKLFPNLKKLAIYVNSKNEFLSSIHDLRDMMIEELKLTLTGTYDMRLDAELETDAHIPSFSSWKKLRKLALLHYIENSDFLHETYAGCTQIFGIPTENILPEGLTSLMLENFQRMQLSFLIKLLQGLPLLMQFELLEGYVVNEVGEQLKRSYFLDAIRSDPLINSNLNVVSAKGDFLGDDSTLLG